MLFLPFSFFCLFLFFAFFSFFCLFSFFCFLCMLFQKKHTRVSPPPKKVASSMKINQAASGSRVAQSTHTAQLAPSRLS
ncbi:MAG: hypothetical protein EBZ77_09235 [Chitinophagia bacterium]|nr:hypothetical protein [Chitinophagia bacterium]